MYRTTAVSSNSLSYLLPARLVISSRSSTP
ncbi:Uncharacterised protein [Mycobacteroides abscessus subsp. abscessus]|nr:Uncharacterised protein [Mycobacteroides abscessus subsp. abscessus]